MVEKGRKGAFMVRFLQGYVGSEAILTRSEHDQSQKPRILRRANHIWYSYSYGL